MSDQDLSQEHAPTTSAAQLDRAALPEAELTREEFCARFKARMLEVAGPVFADGGSVAEYADDAAPTYWDEPHQREEGPEACAEEDLSEWEAE